MYRSTSLPLLSVPVPSFSVSFFTKSKNNFNSAFLSGVSGGSGNHSIWKIDVAAVAVYPISFGGGDAVIADFASVIGA